MSSPQLPPTSSPPSPTWTTHLSEPANIMSALKWGVIVAAAYIIVGTILTLLTNAIGNVGGNDVTKDPLLLIPSCLTIFAVTFGVYVAGYLPANERGNIATGVAGAIVMIVLITGENLIVGAIQGTQHTGVGALPTQIIGALLDLAIALAIGWVGAFYGVKRRAKVEIKA